MASERITRIRVEVDAGSAAEAALAEWLRSWRRRGVRRDGKTLYPNQGAAKATCFHAPEAAIADLLLRLVSAPSGSVTRLPDTGSS